MASTGSHSLWSTDLLSLSFLLVFRRPTSCQQRLAWARGGQGLPLLLFFLASSALFFLMKTDLPSFHFVLSSLSRARLIVSQVLRPLPSSYPNVRVAASSSRRCVAVLLKCMYTEVGALTPEGVRVDVHKCVCQHTTFFSCFSRILLLCPTPAGEGFEDLERRLQILLQSSEAPGGRGSGGVGSASSAEAGRHLYVVGRVNAGKSTFINRLLKFINYRSVNLSQLASYLGSYPASLFPFFSFLLSFFCMALHVVSVVRRFVCDSCWCI